MTDRATARLRALLAQPGCVIAPGVADALAARLVALEGFDAVYMTGFGTSLTRLGMPDVGLLTASEMIDNAGRIVDASGLPVVADADTGYGNPINTRRTIRDYEKAGVAGVHIEDQAWPKRCGHLAGKRVIPAAEMVAKIKAACDARRDPDFVIITRTDAIAVEGLEAALERGERYREAGADVLFIEALRSVEDMKKATARFGGKVPLLANMVEGGKTPVLPTAELEDIGYSIAIFPGGTVRSIAFSLQEYFSTLKRDGGTAAARARMLDFDGLNRTIGTPEMLQLGRKYEG
jgi:2-methylisocitrate lyase-like PEP mutase family enzyme